MEPPPDRQQPTAHLLREFVWSASEGCASAETLMTRLAGDEAGQRAEDRQELLRIIHTLKSGAGLIGLPRMERLAHALEQLLLHCVATAGGLTSEIQAAVLTTLDAVRSSLEHLSTHAAEGDDDGTLVEWLESLSQDGKPPPLPRKPRPAGRAMQPAPARAKAEPPPDPPRPPTGDTPPGPAQPKEPPATLAAPAAAEVAIRVDVELLDRLMNLVGELVLGRNQLLQFALAIDDPRLAATSQVIDRVTSRLQENIMQTRMQPVGVILNKFPRLVRDLSRQLGKQVEFTMSGQETELDRSILEGLRDPFTHILRNCLDHGIESPAERAARGKPDTGKVNIRALHEGGQVVIEVTDDGRGIDAEKVKAKAVAKGLITSEAAARMSQAEALELICLPGLSTAEQVTSVSGRGVGMDVVRSNIERLGGTLAITSQIDQGTTLRITIPLTLAIIPALMVSAGGRLFGLPQGNLQELVSVDPLSRHQIERLGDGDVLRLRGDLLPLIRLANALNLPATTAVESDMRFIVVVNNGDLRFGLVVDEILDTEEIVVKPLSRHFAATRQFAGATIRGDGQICLILDVAGIAQAVRLTPAAARPAEEALPTTLVDEDDFLIFTLGNDERFAIPLSLIGRIDELPGSSLRTIDGHRVLCHDGRLLTSMDISAYTHARPAIHGEQVFCITLRRRPEAAIVATQLVDIERIDLAQVAEPATGGDTVISGLVVSNGLPTAVIDVYRLLELALPRPPTGTEGIRILLVEDSPFHRDTIRRVLEQAGHQVRSAGHGQDALQVLENDPTPIDLVLTDLEMPVMDGWTFLQALRANPRWKQVPALVMSSRDDEGARTRALAAGALRYLVKFDRADLLESIRDLHSQHGR